MLVGLGPLLGTVHPDCWPLSARFCVARSAALIGFCLGCPTVPPPHACAGSTFLSAHQQQTLDTLERHVAYFCSAEPLSSQALGRSCEKFKLLFEPSAALPNLDSSDPVTADARLAKLVADLHSGWDSYARRPRPPAKNRAPQPPPVDPNLPTDLGTCCLPAGLSCKEIFADRIKWTLPPSFNPLPFLTDPVVRAVYMDPDALRLPSREWPKLPAAQVHATRGEILRLASKWDEHQALALVPCSEVDDAEACGCFSVPKDSEFDRFIVNPSVANSRSRPYSNFTKSLAPGFLLALAHIPNDNSVIRFGADDLNEMYYTFEIPPSRAKRNCLRIRFKAHEVEHFQAFARAPCSDHYYVSLRALAMGDCMAVEFAQQSHFNVLRFVAYCMRPSQQVTYRSPAPRSATWEFLSIDDHLTAQVVSRAAWRSGQADRDTSIFAASEVAYKSVGLVQHPRKRRRDELRGVYLGAEADGETGIVGAPRCRIIVLMVLTALVARKGVASSSLLASILGLWVHVFMFRRPVLALLNQSFLDSRREPLDQIMPLHRDTVNELLALSVLGPVLQTDLRVSYTERLFAMDASPDGAGLVEATLPESVVKELWRFSEQHGFYTRLANPAADCLEDLGIDSTPAFGHTDAPAAPQCFPVGRPLAEGVVYDALELFSETDEWTAAHQAAGLRTFPGLRANDGGSPRAVLVSDFHSDAVFHELRGLALRRVVGEWHATPPAGSFQAFRRPRLRSKGQPAGCEAEASVRNDNRLARRIAFLLCLVATNGGYYSIEQPGSSVMFYLQCFVRLASLGGVLTRYCCCSFGAPFKRPRQILHKGLASRAWGSLHLRCARPLSGRRHFLFTEACCF